MRFITYGYFFKYVINVGNNKNINAWEINETPRNS